MHHVDEQPAQTGIPQDEEHVWDVARQALLNTSAADLTLRELGQRTGISWRYLRGDEPVRALLQRTWSQIDGLYGFGRKKTRRLLDIVRAAAGENLQPAISAPENANATDTDRALMQLGIDRKTPIALMFVSARARSLFRREQLHDAGSVLDYLAQNSPDTLRKKRAVGGRTIRELYDFRDAMIQGRVDAVQRFLPTRSSGCGLCFAAIASRLIGTTRTENREALFAHFAQGASLRAAGQRSRRTRARLSQIACWLVRRIDEALSFFPQDKQALWDAWQRCEPVEELLEQEELRALERQTVAGVLAHLFADSPEGRAILTHRRQLFDSWFDILWDCPDFYLAGVRVARFVREQGEPQLLQPYLEFLQNKRNVEVSRTAGTARSTKAPLKRVVRALLTGPNGPLEVSGLLLRLHEARLFPTLQPEAFEQKLRYWVHKGYLPEGKLVLRTPEPSRRGRPRKSKGPRLPSLGSELHPATATDATWYLKTSASEIYGPVTLRQLHDWAATCRVGPDHEVSRDKKTWCPAHEVADLKMEWVLQFPNGLHYGPVHFYALCELVRELGDTQGCTAQSLRTGERCSATDLFGLLDQNRATLSSGTPPSVRHHPSRTTDPAK